MKIDRYPEEILCIVAGTDREIFEKWKSHFIKRVGDDAEDKILWYDGLRLLCKDLENGEGGASYPNLLYLIINRDLDSSGYSCTDFLGEFMRLKIPKPALIIADLQQELAMLL